MEKLGISWPFENEEYMRHRKSWDALSIFAKTYLTAKEIRRAQERINDIQQHQDLLQ